MRRSLRRPAEKALQTARIAEVLESLEAHLADGVANACRLLGLDRNGTCRPSVYRHVGHLREASADRVAATRLVDANDAHPARRIRQLRFKRLEVVLVPERDRRDAKRGAYDRDVRGPKREGRLHDRPPLLQAMRV